ncbi:MAG: hypothetical protein ACKVPX_10700 [Myxococcaceae bacterium]
MVVDGKNSKLSRHAKDLSAWAWVAVSAAFTVFSLGRLIVGSKPGPTAIFVVFSLVSLWMSVATYRARRRLETHLGRAQSVTLPGHVPLRVRRGRFYVMGVGAVAFTVLALAYGRLISPFFPYLVAPIGFAGVLLLLGVLPRNTPTAFMLDENGITLFERRHQWDIRWGEVRRVFPMLVQENTAVGIDFELPGVLNRAHAVHPDFARSLRIRFEKVQRWNGADLVLMAFAFGFDAGLLVQALQRYAQNPEARAELRMPRLEATTQ